MPSSFVRKVASGTLSTATIYTCPANTEATINTILLTNLNAGTNTVTVLINHVSATPYTILDARVLAVNETYSWDGVLNMEYSGSGDQLQVTSSATIHVHVSIIENT